MKNDIERQRPMNTSKHQAVWIPRNGQDLLRFALALVTILMACTAVRADQLGEVRLSDQPIHLLGDRLSIHMPEGSRVEARSVNIMAAEAAAGEETRVVFYQGDHRLVLMAYELFQTAGPDFAEELARTDQPSGKTTTTKYQLVVDRGSFRVYQSDAEPTEMDSEAVRVTSAWVVNNDHTIQLLVGYANPEAPTAMLDVQELFTRALQTLEPGQTQLATRARLQSLDV